MLTFFLGIIVFTINVHLYVISSRLEKIIEILEEFKKIN